MYQQAKETENKNERKGRYVLIKVSFSAICQGDTGGNNRNIHRKTESDTELNIRKTDSDTETDKEKRKRKTDLDIKLDKGKTKRVTSKQKIRKLQ